MGGECRSCVKLYYKWTMDINNNIVWRGGGRLCLNNWDKIEYNS